MSNDTFLRYEACSDCGSKDNVGVWRDGRTNREKRYCFSCNEVKGAEPPEKINWPILDYSHNLIEHRKIFKDTCIKYDVLSAGPIVAFPSYWKGKVIGFKYRDFNFPKSDKRNHMYCTKQYSKHLFGWNTVHTKNIVGIALGEFDAMAVLQATGVPCLSPPNGDASLVPSIKRDFERLSQFDKIYLLPDRDKNNNANTQPSEAVAEAAKLLGEDRCYVAALTYDDPNEYLLQGKTTLLKQAFWSSTPATTDLFYSSTSSLISPTQIGVMTGVEGLDRNLKGLRKGECTYILGAPGKGKTTFVQYLIWSLVQRRVKICVAALEEGSRKFVTRLANMFAGGSYYLINEESAQLVNEVMDKFLLVSKLSGASSVEDMRRTIRAAVKVHSASVVVVDNITAAGDPDKLFESSSKLVLLFDQLAVELDVHFLIISHVTRLSYNEPPTLSSGSGSGFIEKRASNIVGIHRERGENVTRIEVLKNREIGPEGERVFSMEFDRQTHRFVSSKAKEVLL